MVKSQQFNSSLQLTKKNVEKYSKSNRSFSAASYGSVTIIYLEFYRFFSF